MCLNSKTIKRLCYTAVALSLITASIHALVLPEHFEEWWGYGTFFLVTAVAQVGYVLMLLRRPQPWLFITGIVGNVAIIALYLVTRIIGVPFFGPHAGEVEEVGVIDLVSKLAEILLILTLSVLWRAASTGQPPATVRGA